MKRLNRFNNISPYYDTLAKLLFGKAIEKAQYDLLNEIASNDEVLVLGGGSGFWLNYLVELSPSCSIDFIEASDKMIELAKRHLKSPHQLQFIHGTELDIPDKKYDVVILYFFLDMFRATEISKLLGDLNQYVKANSKLLVVDFVQKKLWHKILLVIMYTFFRLIRAIENNTLADWQQVIIKSGYQEKRTGYYFAGFIKGSAYTIL